MQSGNSVRKRAWTKNEKNGRHHFGVEILPLSQFRSRAKIWGRQGADWDLVTPYSSFLRAAVIIPEFCLLPKSFKYSEFFLSFFLFGQRVYCLAGCVSFFINQLSLLPSQSCISLKMHRLTEKGTKYPKFPACCSKATPAPQVLLRSSSEFEWYWGPKQASLKSWNL